MIVDVFRVVQSMIVNLVDMVILLQYKGLSVFWSFFLRNEITLNEKILDFERT